MRPNEQNNSSQFDSSSPSSSEQPVPQDSGNKLIQRVFDALKKFTPLLWIIVILVVIIPLIGQYFIGRSFAEQAPEPIPISIPISSDSEPKLFASQFYDWSDYEKLTEEKMREAHKQAQDFASQELDTWINDLTNRIDNNFLDWYFGYFTQKQIEYRSFFTGIVANFQRWLDPKSRAPEERIAEAITEEFQTEFAKRVLAPEISQLKLESIATKTAKKYLKVLKEEFNEIPIENNISPATWERYLRETAIDIPNVEGKIIETSLQKLTLAGGYVVFKPLIAPLVPKVSSAVVGTLAGKAGAKIAAKTGSVLATKIGGTFLDATVGVGILLWDIWDTNHTASIEKPILRQNLVDYLQLVKESVLDNPDNGIMTVVEKIDQTILRSIHIARDLDPYRSEN